MNHDLDIERSIPEAARLLKITPAVLRSRIRAGWVTAWPVVDGSDKFRTTLRHVMEGSERMAAAMLTNAETALATSTEPHEPTIEEITARHRALRAERRRAQV